MDEVPSQSSCPPGSRVQGPLRWILATQVLLVILVATFAFRPSRPMTQPVWEYKIEQIADSGFTDRVNVLGQKGWEVISASRTESPDVGYEVIFKRPATIR